MAWEASSWRRGSCIVATRFHRAYADTLRTQIVTATGHIDRPARGEPRVRAIGIRLAFLVAKSVASTGAGCGCTAKTAHRVVVDVVPTWKAGRSWPAAKQRSIREIRGISDGACIGRARPSTAESPASASDFGRAAGDCPPLVPPLPSTPPPAGDPPDSVAPPNPPLAFIALPLHPQNSTR